MILLVSIKSFANELTPTTLLLVLVVRRVNELYPIPTLFWPELIFGTAV